MRIAPIALCWAGLLAAQSGTPPKAKPEEYPAHAAAGKLRFGADYMVHSFAGGGQTFVAEDYLVVEIAIYPPRFEEVMVSSGHWALRLNGKKQMLAAQAPGFVAASLKYEDWDRTRSLEAGGSLGNAGVILGRPAPVGRFPGDPTARRRLPEPPKAPGAEEKEPAKGGDEVAVETALPEGLARGPVSGYLYFAYRGKIKSIKSVELVYQGPEGKAQLPLM